MRIAWLGVLAACGNDAGAQLTLHAPRGPGAAASIEIVLATPDRVPVVMNQRVALKGGQTETVTYYLQRTTANLASDPGAIDQVDGFTVRIVPSADVGDRAFIPFVLLRDSAGVLIGAGTFHAPGQTTPSPILVQPDEIDTYTIDVEPVADIDTTDSVLPGNALVVQCMRPDQSTFDSGIAWRPAQGGELRIVFPDQPGSLDASERRLDLDCDDHVPDNNADCDDTRGNRFRGAPEACDGFDADCEDSQYLTYDCPPSTLCPNLTAPGVGLCDDSTGHMVGCIDPACICAKGQPGCMQCSISHPMQTAAGMISPCQPSIGVLSTQNLCGSIACSVQILDVRGGWKAEVAKTTSGPFGSQAIGVGGSFALKAFRPEGPGVAIAGNGGEVTGRVDLVVVDGMFTAHLFGVLLAFEGDIFTTCTGNGPFAMACSP